MITARCNLDHPRDLRAGEGYQREWIMITIPPNNMPKQNPQCITCLQDIFRILSKIDSRRVMVLSPLLSFFPGNGKTVLVTYILHLNISRAPDLGYFVLFHGFYTIWVFCATYYQMTAQIDVPKRQNYEFKQAGKLLCFIFVKILS